MTSPARILTVCTGNVCRSPYLERRLQGELDRVWGAGAFEVRSAGTGALEGSGMEPQSLALLEGRGGSGADFIARQLSKEILADQQLVIVASREHRKLVTRMWPKGLARTHTLIDLAQLAGKVSNDELPSRELGPRGWLAALGPVLAAKRGLELPRPAAEAEVVDPIGQGPEVFSRMQEQIEAALPPVLRVLGA
ncbi:MULTISPECIES: arsenate reductase/protein-tyrosine-phosphatase family protein [unclassified Luteococcus]|uniref:arsenate reductase/protein-tyrosine-phosphatase family protein n=1 Tax=unclassified Luteococcus TaxID=2639923 RepID=UPI00313E5A5B